jgi:hypothetical protein
MCRKLLHNCIYYRQEQFMREKKDLHSVKMIFENMVKCPTKLQNGVQLSLQKKCITVSTSEK